MAHDVQRAGRHTGASTRKGGKGAGLGANGVATNGGEERLVEPFLETTDIALSLDFYLWL
jgi:hypothetical protein